MCIDKLDVRIPRKTQFTPEFQEAYAHAQKKGLLRPSSYYAHQADFRPYGYCIRLHMFSCFGKKHGSKTSHDHKVELYDTGVMTFDEMLEEISRVFICDPLDLTMLRRDECVDVEEISFNWLKTHTRVEFKRNIREFGYMVIFKRRGETLCFGEREGQIRLYDKAAERRNEYAYKRREAKKEGYPCPSFEEMYGHPDDAVITRIERQYGGKQCSGNLRSLLKLDRTNPFKPVKFLPGNTREISRQGLDCTTFWAAQHLQVLLEQNGAHYVRAHINDVVGSKNAKKTWDRFSHLIAPCVPGISFDEEMLHKLYLKSVMKQLGFVGQSAAYPDGER